MIAAYQVAALLNRERAPLNTVSLAALVLLVINPEALFDPSFQLTFLAVLTIAGLAVPLIAAHHHCRCARLWTTWKTSGAT